MILTIRTDKPEAEIGLYLNDKQVAYDTWLAHRELSSTIHTRIESLLRNNKSTLQSLTGILCYKGPGSFTGLRIGITVANALANSLRLPIVSETGEDWIKRGIERISLGESEIISLPEYGSEVHTTPQKK